MSAPKKRKIVTEPKTMEEPLLCFLISISLDDDSLIAFSLTSKTINQIIKQKIPKRLAQIQQSRKSYPVPGGGFARLAVLVDATSSLIKADPELFQKSKMNPGFSEHTSFTESYFFDSKCFVGAYQETAEAPQTWTLNCWDSNTNKMLWTKSFEFLLENSWENNDTSAKRLVSFFIDAPEKIIWISRVNGNKFVISKHAMGDCAEILSKTFPRKFRTLYPAAPTLALYDKYVMYVDNRNGNLVLLNKDSLEEVMTISPLSKERQTQSSRADVPNYSLPNIKEDLVRKITHKDRNYYIVCDTNDGREENNMEPEDDENAEQEGNEEDENEDEDEDDENEQRHPTDYTSMKKEMGRICVSPVVNNDQSVTVRIAWYWDVSAHVAVFHHHNDKLQLQHQYHHKIHYNTQWGSDYQDMLEGFCESDVYLCLYENDLIITVDVHGEKCASSFLHIVDVTTGKFLWRCEGDLVWFFSAPCVYDHTLYFVNGDGVIVALDLRNRSFSPIWEARFHFFADDEHYAKARIAIARTPSKSSAMFLFIPGYDIGCQVFCINRKTGEMYWQWEISGVASDQFVQGSRLYGSSCEAYELVEANQNV